MSKYVNSFINRCSAEDFLIELKGSCKVEENHIDKGRCTKFKTGLVKNSWIRAFQPIMSVNFANRINFGYKGNMPQDTSIMSRIGLGMEGPDDVTRISPKVGLEGYGENEAGSLYRLITGNEISRHTEPTPFQIKENSAKCYTFTLEPGVSCTLEFTDGTVILTTCCIPSYIEENPGLTFGLKTLDEEEKYLSLMSIMFQCM